MKPNLKTKTELVKTTFNGKSNPLQKQNSQKMKESQLQQLPGQRQFVYLDNKPISNNSSQFQALDQNLSLGGTRQKVYFTNASTLNRQQLQKDKKLYQEMNAFKPSQKIARQDEKNNKNFKKAKTTVPQKNKNLGQSNLNQDDNQFLELNKVGKWHKNNKSTVVSEQMMKMTSHLQNRLTETKWVKKKVPDSKQENDRAQTEKNKSISRKQPQKLRQSQSLLKEGKSSLLLTEKRQDEDFEKMKLSQHHDVTIDRYKKLSEKYMQGVSTQNKQKLSSMTSWKQKQKEQQQQQQIEEDQPQQQQQSQQSSEQQQQQQQEEQESQQQQQDQQEQENQNDNDDEQSSGDEGWDQPQDQTPQDQNQQQQQNKNPFIVPQTEEELKQRQTQNNPIKKWGQSSVKPAQQPELLKNTSIKVEKSQQRTNQSKVSHQNDDQIEDLTEGQIQHDQIDPNWEQLQKVLLRIQKIVN